MSLFDTSQRAAKRGLKDIWRVIRRPVIGTFGGVVLLLGIIMIVTPGPAVVFIPLGLGILSSQFPVVRKWIRPIRRRVQPVIGWAGRKWRTFRGRRGKDESSP